MKKLLAFLVELVEKKILKLFIGRLEEWKKNTLMQDC